MHPEVMTDNKRVPPEDDGRGQASRRRFLRPDSWDGAALYRQADKRAQWVKAIVQMAIGVGTVIAVTILIWFPQLRTGGLAELALRTVASGLALAAVVELTYTLFTEGPDEALDPLILGLSSFILLKLSDPETGLTVSNAGTFALLVLALAALFVVREQFIEKPKREQARREGENSGN
jgi:hypothetical protein